jgi:hypothetical protein
LTHKLKTFACCCRNASTLFDAATLDMNADQLECSLRIFKNLNQNSRRDRMGVCDSTSNMEEKGGAGFWIRHDVGRDLVRRGCGVHRGPMGHGGLGVERSLCGGLGLARGLDQFNVFFEQLIDELRHVHPAGHHHGF